MACKVELIWKTAALALAASILGLVLRRTNPEYGLLLGVTATAVILLASLRFLDGMRTLVDAVSRMSGGDVTILRPILKCLAVAVVTQVASGLCRDAAQSAAAAAVEFAGSVCAMSVALPLLLSMLNMVGALL